MSRDADHHERASTSRQQIIAGLPQGVPEPTSRSEAARQGGLTTLERYGTDHFRELGKLGFAVTAERYGRDFAHDMAAAAREAHPERSSHDEQRVMQMLAELGQGDLLAGEAVSYRREHKVAPSIHVDFAWPDVRKALEVYGGIHHVLAIDPDGLRAQREAAREERIRDAGWSLLTVTDKDLTARNWAGTSDKLAAFLETPSLGWIRNEGEQPA